MNFVGSVGQSWLPFGLDVTDAFLPDIAVCYMIGPACNDQGEKQDSLLYRRQDPMTNDPSEPLRKLLAKTIRAS